MSCNVRNWLVCAAGSLLIAGCGSGSGGASSSLDKMTETQRNEVMQKTVQNTMEKNVDAMKQAGMNPEAGAGFQPPDSMKKYMNKGGGGAPGGGSTSGGSTPGGSSAPSGSN